MKKIVLGLFFWASFARPASADNIIYLNGYVPHVQQFKMSRSLNGLNMQYKHNSKASRPKVTVEVQRQGLEVDTQELASQESSLFYEDFQDHPIQKVTLIQH